MRSTLSQGTILSLFSSEGRRLHIQFAMEGKQEIDLKGISAGTYFLQANIPNGAIATKSFIKTN